MNLLNTLALIFHMLFAVGIVGLVLLQRGKGAEAGAGFGAGASGTVFGARGSGSFLSRATAILATLFFVTSLTLAYFGGRPATQGSVMDTLPAAKTEAPVSAPALPNDPAINVETPAPAAAPTATPEAPSK